MNQKLFSLVAGSIFLVVALAHALRLVFGWHVVLQGWTVPLWVSWIALVISGFLAYEGLALGRALADLVVLGSDCSSSRDNDGDWGYSRNP